MSVLGDIVSCIFRHSASPASAKGGRAPGVFIGRIAREAKIDGLDVRSSHAHRRATTKCTD